MARENENNSRLKTALALAFVLLIILLMLRWCHRCQPREVHTAPGPRIDTVYIPRVDTVYVPVPADTVVEGVYDAVDVVMCIDATGSMAAIINTVTNHAVNFCDDLKHKCEENGKSIGNFRVRVLGFRDYEFPEPPMEDSGFLVLPDQSSNFRAFTARLRAQGGGPDGEESALEALGLAMDSEWSREGHSRCRVIVLWTDNQPKNLGRGRSNGLYPSGVPSNLSDLRTWWETEKMGGGAKRMVLFAPASGTWRIIKDQWSDITIGDYTNPRDYDAILQTIVDAL